MSMKKSLTLIIIALLSMAVEANAQGYRHWDFTNWSPQTVANLQAEAAQTRPAKGWSDIEKRADDKEGAVAPEATKGKCFWYDADEGGYGTLMANGEPIVELEGLDFGESYSKNRSLAIAVDYPSTSLGTYDGPQYLWLGGGCKNMVCFTIHNVAIGEKMTFVVESHKPSDARGIGLYVGSISDATRIGDNFTPTTKETNTWENWEMPEGATDDDGDGLVDIIVYNTSGCHLYSIEVGVEDKDKKRPTALLYSGSLDSDLTYATMLGNESLDVTPIEATASLTRDDLAAYDAVVISSTVTGDDVVSNLKALRPFLPMLNLNPNLYAAWGCGEATMGDIQFATVSNASHPLFRDIELIEDPDAETPVFVLQVTNDVTYPVLTLAGDFAADAVLARPYGSEDYVAIHAHNMGHNGFLYLPYTQEVLPDAPTAAQVIGNAVALLGASKAAVTQAPKPTITLSYKKMMTEVTIASGVPGAQVFYTLDGSEPTELSTRYTEPFTITAEGVTVKAVARGDGYLMSDVAEMAVDLKDQADAPVIALSTDADGQTVVSLSGSSETDQIYFNLIGSSDPNRSQLYTEPFVLNDNALVGAFVEADSVKLRSELTTRQVYVTDVVYTDVLTKFEGASYNNVTNKVADGGYNFYTDEVIREEILQDVYGEDSIVHYYAPRDSMILMTLSDDWQVRTRGQGLYYTKATPTHNVGKANGYNPETVFDDMYSDGEITNNAMQFQVVKKTDGDGRLDPVSLSLECKRPLVGPFEVSVYFSGKNFDSANVLDIAVNTDTLRADGWQKIGGITSLSKAYYDGSSEKSFRVWKRGVVRYDGTDPVFVRINSVEKAKDVNIFTVLVKAKGEFDAIKDVERDDALFPVDGKVYDLQGRRVSGAPQRGIYITNGKKHYVR